MKGLINAAKRLMRYRKTRGTLAVIYFVLSRICRLKAHVVYEARCADSRVRSSWCEGDQLLTVGPEDIDAKLGPELYAFLGGGEAFEAVQGVRNGDVLFVVKHGKTFVHCGYIVFKTKETQILGEHEPTPLIACCKTAPTAQGRGLYRKALNEEVLFLKEHGYTRVIIATAPDNTASRRGIEAAGFKLVRKVSVVIILNCLVMRRLREERGTKSGVFFLRSEKHLLRSTSANASC
jgi:hypothetical protein